MRFADTDGTIVDVYQQNTNMNDEAGQAYPATVNALLDNAVGANGYYGAFGVNIHTDNAAPNASTEAIVTSAQARDVPIVSYRQLLDWTDGRNASTIRDLAWSSGTFTFMTTVGAGADGPADAAADAGPDRDAERPHVWRLADELHRADDQGRPVRDVPGDHRHLPGDLLIGRAPSTGRIGRSPASPLPSRGVRRDGRAREWIPCAVRSCARGRPTAEQTIRGTRGHGPSPLCSSSRASSPARRRSVPARGVRRARRRRARRGVLVQRGLRGDGARRLGQRPSGDDRRARPGRRRALRRRAVVRRDERPRRPRQPRNLLPERLHARGVGQEDDRHEEGRRRPRHVDGTRGGPDDLGRPSRGALPADDGTGPRELPRLGGDAGRGHLAAPRGDVRRHRRSVLRRRHRGRRPHGLGRVRRVEHVARRRVRQHADRVLRRRDRRDPHLLARAERGGDRRGPRRGARRSRHDAAERARHADRDRRVRPGEPHLGRRHRRGRGDSLQRAPLDDGGLHARCVEPHRAADRHELRSTRRSRPARTTTG